LRQARAPRPTVRPPWERDATITYDIDNLPKLCAANHVLLNTAAVNEHGHVVCNACIPLVPKQPHEPMVPFEFATTGGRGLANASVAFEREVTTRAELLRREQLTRLTCIRRQLACDQAIVWNNPTAAGEWYDPSKPQGVGIYVWPLSDDERHKLVVEANELRAILHVGIYND
jgi:hypothetical protein